MERKTETEDTKKFPLLVKLAVELGDHGADSPHSLDGLVVPRLRLPFAQDLAGLVSGQPAVSHPC